MPYNDFSGDAPEWWKTPREHLRRGGYEPPTTDDPDLWRLKQRLPGFGRFKTGGAGGGAGGSYQQQIPNFKGPQPGLFQEIYKQFFPNGMKPDEWGAKWSPKMSGDVSDWLKGAAGPVKWSSVSPTMYQNPMQVIEGARAVLQDQARRMMNEAASRFAAAGMGVSTPYMEALGGVQGETARQLADISNRYLFEAARERQQAELQAALANQGAELQAQDIERRARLGAAQIGSEYDWRGALARGESYKTIADLARTQALTEFGHQAGLQQQQLQYLYNMMLNAIGAMGE